MPPGAKVAIVGAGNGDDLPLARLAHRAARVDLIDLDARAIARARRRAGPWAGRVALLPGDVTGGEADRLVAAARGRLDRPRRNLPQLGPADYDVVIADLFLTQLLYPALRDAGVPPPVQEALLRGEGQDLVDRVVSCLHEAGAKVIVLNDVLGWWDGHPQPFRLEEVLELDDQEAEALVAMGQAPRGCDIGAATHRAGADVVASAYWRWPFARGTDYLVHATVAGRKETRSQHPHEGPNDATVPAR